jgi:hypothetical protein
MMCACRGTFDDRVSQPMEIVEDGGLEMPVLTALRRTLPVDQYVTDAGAYFAVGHRVLRPRPISVIRAPTAVTRIGF